MNFFGKNVKTSKMAKNAMSEFLHRLSFLMPNQSESK